MDVSVIILNFNTYDYTLQCIESIVNHTLNIQYEIILVDNASTECDPNLFKEKYPFVKLIKSAKNIGFSRGCNLGISEAKGKTFLLLNSDTKLTENSIKICFNELLLENNTMLIAPKTLYEDGRLQPTAEVFPSIISELVLLFKMNKFLSNKVNQKYVGFQYFNYNVDFFPPWLHGSFLLFKSEALNLYPNKKLPETFFMYSEDMEFGFIIHEKGYKIKYTAKTNFIHFRGKTTYYYNPNINEIKNSAVFLKKYYSSSKAFFILLLRGVRLITSFHLKNGFEYLKFSFSLYRI